MNFILGDMEIWQIWIIASVLLFIVEVFAPTFLASCIAIGCLASGIFAFLDFGFKTQLVVFSVGAIISFFCIMPFMMKYAHKKSINVKTNANALVGKIGRVAVTIDNSRNQGRAIVEGDDWKVETENDEIVNEGEKVEVLKVNSTILIVKPINKN